METVIKRVNFFDGQFLQEGDFQTEQTYHLHMRQRLNYMLFEQPGVIANVEPQNDDLQFEVVDDVARTFRVKPGTAVALVSAKREGKEIVVPELSAVQSLDTAGVGATDAGFVVVRQVEWRTKDPPSLGDVNEDTRVEERYEISIEAAWPPPSPPPDFEEEEYVFLGTLTFNPSTSLLEPDYTNRHEAKIRTSLIGGLAPGATLLSITIAPLAATLNVGNVQAFEAIGHFDSGPDQLLSPADGLSWSSADATIASIDANTGQAVGVAVGGPVTITATVGAVQGTATLTVAPTPPVITQFTPTLLVVGTSLPRKTIEVRGTNIRDPALGPNTPATGTVVRLVDPSDHTNVLAPTFDATVLANIAGNIQRVRVGMPLASEFSGTPSLVHVQLEFNGQTVTSTDNLTLWF